MSRMQKLRMLSVAVVFFGWGRGVADAQELLFNGDLEHLTGIPGWSLDETVTGEPGVAVDSASFNGGFANLDGIEEGTGLFLKAFAGNVGPFQDQNKPVNAHLSQTVPGVAGESYTFSGWSIFEQNYSGGVDFLDSLSPSGAIASPTEGAFELAFLNASDAVIGTPVTLDLRTEQFPDGVGRQHTLMGTAPAGTASVRVTASATDMLFNIDPQQSAAYDAFSLTAGGSPGTELLGNANLNEPAEAPGTGWTLIEMPEGTDTAEFAQQEFANHTSDGNKGVWLKAFAEGDATVTQTVEGDAGDEYSFSVWSKWEANYSGGMAGSATETMLELAFLDDSQTVLGTPVSLDLRTEQMNDDTWREHTLMGTAPAGTEFVRISGIATGMFDTEGAQSAFFDDFSLVVAPTAVPGDFDGDGDVDGADFVIWQTNFPTQEGATLATGDADGDGDVDGADFVIWQTNFPFTPAAGTAAVPEPATAMLALVAAAGLGLLYRRR